jgi:hypothetical protein
MNTGWSCPRCSRVYAPSVTGCSSCNAFKNDPWIVPNVPTPVVPLPFFPHPSVPSVPWVAPPGERDFPKYFLAGGAEWRIE